MPDQEQKITKEIFEHLVGLAALELGEDESEYIRKELNNQLAAIDELTAIEIPEGIKPAAHGVPYPDSHRQPLRTDQWEPCDDTDEILSQAPKIEERYIIVPDIPHTSLE